MAEDGVNNYKILLFVKFTCHLNYVLYIEHVSYVKPRTSNLSWKLAVKYHFMGLRGGIEGGGYFGGGVLKCMMTF